MEMLLSSWKKLCFLGGLMCPHPILLYIEVPKGEEPGQSWWDGWIAGTELANAVTILIIKTWLNIRWCCSYP
ncbi:unnamed protein product [Musa textilis]